MLTVKQQDEVLNSLTYMPPCGFRSVPPWIRWRQVIVTLVLSHRFKEMVESEACFPQRQSHSMKWAKFFLLHIFYTVCILEKTTFILNCYWRKQVQTESKCKKVHINIGKKLFKCEGVQPLEQLSGEVVESPLLEIFNWTQPWAIWCSWPCFKQRVWTRCSPDVSFSVSLSMILRKRLRCMLLTAP